MSEEKWQSSEGEVSVDPGLKEAVAARAKDGGLACREAMALANEFNVAPIKVGAAANALKIKIKGCQLGCFR
jgi:hypothetical protein